ncbi:hypothetical protein ACFE04_022002 [Oxalis oulophora]
MLKIKLGIQNVTVAQAKLTTLEVGEILDYFNRRVASKPYNASRVASFITLLTLPIPVLREFVKLMSCKKRVASRAQAGQIASDQKHRIELRLENHSGLNMGPTVRSNIFFNRPHNSVDHFALTVVLDPAQIPQMNSDGGAACLCLVVVLRLSQVAIFFRRIPKRYFSWYERKPRRSRLLVEYRELGEMYTGGGKNGATLRIFLARIQCSFGKVDDSRHCLAKNHTSMPLRVE